MSASDDLRKLLAELKATETLLLAQFEDAQAQWRAKREQCRAIRDQLVALRAEFGGHLKLAATGSITVEE